MGTFIFLGIGGIAAFGVIYYLKILKPKQEREYSGESNEDTDEYEDIPEGEDSE